VLRIADDILEADAAPGLPYVALPDDRFQGMTTLEEGFLLLGDHGVVRDSFSLLVPEPPPAAVGRDVQVVLGVRAPNAREALLLEFFHRNSTLVLSIRLFFYYFVLHA
jgi:hypothetical protein